MGTAFVLLVTWCVLGIAIAPADGQTVTAAGSAGGATYGPPPANWRPIDQAHEDLDPLARGGRIMQKGLRTNGEQTSLFEVTTPNVSGSPLLPPETTLYRIAPGFRARVDRMNYLVRVGVQAGGGPVALNHIPAQDGEFFELPGEGLVYELSPTPQLPTPRVYRPSPYLIDGRTVPGAMQSNVFLLDAPNGGPNRVAGFAKDLPDPVGHPVVLPSERIEPSSGLMRPVPPRFGGDGKEKGAGKEKKL